ARILEAIRERISRRPEDLYLRNQAALIDTAQISTLHAFCLWMLRRCFSQAGIDPTAPILDEDEAQLLRSETLETVFTELYTADTEPGRGFVRLVGDYGLGRDTGLAEVVLKLADFLRSLPHPRQWLDLVRSAVGASADDTVAGYQELVGTEMMRQRAHVEQLADYVERDLPEWTFYGQKVRDYAEALTRWSQSGDWDALRDEIAALEITTRGAPRLAKGATDDESAGRDAARSLLDDVRKRLFGKQLRPLVRFSETEMHRGLTDTAPYLDTLIELVGQFDARYTRAKKAMDVLDFADLERGAYDLLRDENDLPGISVVAREFHTRFAHVLVDEFQDINPLQDAILKLSSRESDPDRDDNLFCVGDVKQSIYRFRLAEPQVFQSRVENADRDDSTAVCVGLQENFRSDPYLIDGINLLFERLMSREMGGVAYDESARLRPGLQRARHTAPAPVELHLLQRRLEPRQQEDEEQRYVDPTDPASWQVIEREAYLIGTRIRELRRSGMTVDGRPPQWRDIAVLLRAPAHTAAPMVEILGRMGIPSCTPVGSPLLASTEVRDVLALLTVLDNPQQDIPLASVLRSGVAGLSFTEDDLVAMRCLDREVPFHEAVRRYRSEGDDADLGLRLGQLLDRLARWRRDARRRPLADVLWNIYRQSGYLAYVGGLARGQTRRANLLALHERARQFGGFQKQGLHRFLRFIESLESSGRDLAAAPPTGQAQDVVTIMSIHRSKGLEFPVVFVADLAHRFNLDDARGDIIFDRRLGLGLRVVDPQRLIKYPSILHKRVARSIEANTRDEELRILYVALTRACQRLILVGSTDLQGVVRDRELSRRSSGAVSPLTLASAGTPLDWIIPALAAAPPESVQWPDKEPAGQSGDPPLHRVEFHTEDEMADWHLETSTGVAENPALAAAARLKPLPAEEPRSADDFDDAAVLDRLDYPYPHLAASSVRAALAVSEAKRAADPFTDEHQPTGQPYYRPSFDPPAVLAEKAPRLTPQERGTLTHRVLQLWNFAEPIEQALQRLVDAGRLTAEQPGIIDSDALTWFADTPLGRRIRDAGGAYRREFLFISAESADLFDPALEGTCDERVLVRGIADGVLTDSQGLEIVDFKTDALSPDAVAARADGYRLQMQLYARAVARIWRRPVTRCWLIFLAPRRIVEIPQEQSAP
ncbi:MAG: helicase-exonuclease AddAB subunit AddA, partial [Planctomycetota bacterium]